MEAYFQIRYNSGPESNDFGRNGNKYVWVLPGFPRGRSLCFFSAVLPEDLCKTVQVLRKLSNTARSSPSVLRCSKMIAYKGLLLGHTCRSYNQHWLNYIEDRKGTTKKLRDKDFVKRLCELSGAVCLKMLVLLVMTGNPSNCSENYLVLFVRFLGFMSPFCLLITQITTLGAKNQRKLFCAKFLGNPSRHGRPRWKIVDVRARKTIVLRPRWRRDTFWPPGSRA